MDAKDAKEESTPEAKAAESDTNDDDDDENGDESEQLKPETDDKQGEEKALDGDNKSDTATAQEPPEERVKSLYELSGQLVVKLEGTHTSATATESSTSVAAACSRRVSFEHVIEECTRLSPSTSKVVENVREYVKQIERVLEMDEGGLRVAVRAPQPTDALVVEAPKATLKVVNVKSAEAAEQPDANREPDRGEESKRRPERPAESAPESDKSVKTAEMKQVEMENQEIAERFKLIMEMFDNFTKNLESLEMPAIKDKEEELLKPSDVPALPAPTQTPTPTPTVAPTAEMDAIERCRRLSFKSLQDLEHAPELCSSVPPGAEPQPYNEFYRQLHGDRADTQPSVGPAEALAKADPIASTSTQLQRTVAAAAPPSSGGGSQRCDIATTCSGLELLQLPPLAQRMATIGCQTSQFEYVAMLPHSDSSSFSTSRSDTQNDGGDCRFENFILDAPASPVAASGAEPKKTVTVLDKAPESAGLLKLAEPLALSSSPAATAAVTAGTGAGTGNAAVTANADALCERTFHTIHIEATSSPSSSVMHRPPLCVRMWNVITDFCAAVCLCLQVNKDCLFCLGFFFAFVVSASFLTAFFYRTLSINPQLFRLPPTQANIEQMAIALQTHKREI